MPADAALWRRIKALKYALLPDSARWLDVILAEAPTLNGVNVIAVPAYIILVRFQERSSL